MKPPHKDKYLGLDPAIRFYDIEDSYNTGEGEYSEILIIQD